MKIIATDKELSPKYIKNLLNEREVFSVLKSEFCVNALATFIYKTLVCFVMEYLPGRDLYEEVFERENLWFSSSTIKHYLAELVIGISDLHQNGILHRDIKPANVLIDEEGHLKLTDFGLSEFRAKIATKSGDGKTLIKGSAQYLAPEVVKGQEAGFEVDWWALGVMIYLMINQEFPFDGESVQEVMDKIVDGVVDWSNVGDDEDQGQMSFELADLTKKLLDPDPQYRLGHNGVDEIKNHPYFAKFNWQRAANKQLFMFPPTDILDLNKFKDQGSDMRAFADQAFSELLEEEKIKNKNNLAFSNRFELVRIDQYHRRNIKVGNQIKKAMKSLSKEQGQVVNVIQDYCLREELFFYRNFNNFSLN